MDVYRHFGLTGPPFSVTPDPRFAYETRDHKLALVKVLYSVTERRGLFLLQGEIGTGKTTLSRFLLQGLTSEPDKYLAAHVNSPATRSQAGFLRIVMESFGLETPRNLNALNKLLLSFLMESRREGKAVVLMLDEAQMISPVCLDLLHAISNHQTISEQLMQIVLFAQPNIVHKLEQRPALRSRITGGAYLGPLSFDDAIEMLRHRVGVAGGDFDVLFPLETHKGIYNFTGGIARELCVLADSALVIAYALGKPAVSGDIVIDAVKDLRFKGWQNK